MDVVVLHCIIWKDQEIQNGFRTYLRLALLSFHKVCTDASLRLVVASLPAAVGHPKMKRTNADTVLF